MNEVNVLNAVEKSSEDDCVNVINFVVVSVIKNRDFLNLNLGVEVT